jgi:hypothetical protein
VRTREQEVAAFTWLKPKHVAKRLDVSAAHVLNLLHSGELEGIDVSDKGKKPDYRISPDSMAAFEQRRKVPSAA